MGHACFSRSIEQVCHSNTYAAYDLTSTSFTIPRDARYCKTHPTLDISPLSKAIALSCAYAQQDRINPCYIRTGLTATIHVNNLIEARKFSVYIYFRCSCILSFLGIAAPNSAKEVAPAHVIRPPMAHIRIATPGEGTF